jgi:hypothetical protein
MVFSSHIFVYYYLPLLIGQRVTLKLDPWTPDFEKKYGRLNRSLAEDLDLMTVKHWWGR